MPFIGNAGQFSNIHEKNYASSTLRVVEGDALYQAYNPADSHYKLITTLQEVTTIGSVTANTIQFTNPITSLVTSSNIGVANTQPMHTLDVGANVYIDDRGSTKIHTSGTTYAKNVTGDTAVITDTVTVRDTIVDRVFPKTNDFVRFMSNVGVLNTSPIHTLDIGANVQIDEYGSNTFYTSGNVYSEHFKSSNITVSGAIDTDEAIINHINAKSTDFVNFTSNVGILNTAPIHTLDIGANVQIDEYGSNTFYTSGNVHANKFTGEEITLAGTIVASDFILSGVGASATPTPQLQTVSEALPQSGQIAFSSDRTLTLSNTTAAMNATIINVITTNSNLVGDNVTVVTTRSNLIAGNVTVDNNLIVNTDDFVVDTVNSRVGINKASPTKDLDVTGEIECSSHLTVGGNISGNGDAVFRKYTIASPGAGQYSVIGPGFDTATVNPTLTLIRGQKYVFDNTVSVSHPLEIRDGYQGSAYTPGVIGNGTATVIFTVPMDAPIKLYYQCTLHPAMGNIIYIPESTLDTSLALNISNTTSATQTSLGTTDYPTLGGNWLTIFSPTFDGDIGDNHPDPDGGILFTNQSSNKSFPWGYYMGVVKDVASTSASSVRFDIGKSSDLNSQLTSGHADTLTPYLTIDNGNVGIGTTDPEDNLHIYSNESGGTQLKIQNANTTGDTRAGLFLQTRSSNVFSMQFTPSGETAIFDNEGQGGYAFYQKDSGGTTNHVMQITKDGNVGIGTTSPRALLDMCGPVSVPAILTSGAGSSEGDIAVLSGEAMQIGHWDNATTTFTNRIHVTSGGNVGIANTNPQHKLSVGGSVRHAGLVLSEGTNIDQITSITKTLGVTVSWMDTGIKGTDLVTGSYIVQIENHSDPSGGTYRNYNEYYTGFMSWYSESNGTNDTDASEIILHAAGHATEDNHIYLRVLRQLGNADLKLQIRRDFDRSGQPVGYKFKFRRMM